MKTRTFMLVVAMAVALIGCTDPIGSLLPSTIIFADGQTISRQLGSGPYTNPVSGTGSGSIIYYTENPSVAMVNASTGEVTLKSLGSTTIIAVKLATSTHDSVTNFYALSVTNLTPSTIVFADGNTVSKQVDSGFYVNAVSGVGSGAITYSSVNTNVATVDASSGIISLLSVGQTIITATKAQEGTYDSVSSSYTLTVTAIPSTIVFGDGDSITRMLGSAPFTNMLSGEGSGTITYTSGTTEVASVDPSTGLVTLVRYPWSGLGSTVITAMKTATATHSAITRSYTLTVTEPKLADGTRIGDPYQGGVLAYILRFGEPGYETTVDHGIVLSLDDHPSLSWAPDIIQFMGSTGYAIGTGQENTQNIVTFFGAGTTYAAGWCDAYTNSDTGTGIYSDWYLPSTQEYDTLCHFAPMPIGLSGGTYWTSSSHSYGSFLANKITVDDVSGLGVGGGQTTYNNTFRVIAIRSF